MAIFQKVGQQESIELSLTLHRYKCPFQWANLPFDSDDTYHFEAILGN